MADALTACTMISGRTGLTTTQEDVVVLLIDQHNRIKSLFQQLRTAQGAQQQELFQDLVRLLAAHETAEELVVHPAARRQLNHGKEVVDARLHEEGEAKRELAALYDMGVEHPDFDARLADFANAVIEHAGHEEADEFPGLRLAGIPRRQVLTQTRTAPPGRNPGRAALSPRSVSHDARAPSRRRQGPVHPAALRRNRARTSAGAARP